MGPRAVTDRGMAQAHGLWWPAGSEHYVKRYVGHAEDLAAALKFCRATRVAVQAGGHCGAWPLWLSRRFDRVYTWEPDAANFACLGRNVWAEAGERIFAARGMLGKAGGMLSLSHNRVNIGGHKGTQLPGPVPVYRLDDLNLPACDLIQLDVEGMELPALQGARHTLERLHPVLMLEDRDHGARHGWGSREDIVDYLRLFHYQEAARIGHDVVFA